MKKRLCLILSVFIALSSLTACGSSDETEEEEKSNDTYTAEEMAAFSAEEAAKVYIEAAYEGNVGRCYDLHLFDNVIREQAYDDLAEDNDMTTKEYFESLAEQHNAYASEEEQVDFSNYDEYLALTNITKYSSYQEMYEEEYGKNYSITVEITETIEIDTDDYSYYRNNVDDKINDFEYCYSTDIEFDGEDIEEFIQLEYSVTIEGKEDESYNEGLDIYLGKIDGRWKVLQSSSDSMIQ